MQRHSQSSQGAFALLEIIIVIGLIAAAYVIALPNFRIQQEVEVANKVGLLNADVRSAFDMAVLNARTYRLVFHLWSGDYWLEEADRNDVYLADEKLDRDPLPEDEEYFLEEFNERFARYEELLGETIKDPNSDKEYPPTSPVIAAKDALRRPAWRKVENTEWAKRSLGPQLIIRSMQAEHHGRPVTVDDLGDEAVAHLYFLPSGYVERAVIHIHYRNDEGEPDLEQTPFTLKTRPYQGEAVTEAGFEDVNVNPDS